MIRKISNIVVGRFGNLVFSLIFKYFFQKIHGISLTRHPSWQIEPACREVTWEGGGDVIESFLSDQSQAPNRPS